MRDGSVTTTPMGKTRSIAAPIKMAARVTSGGGIRTPTHQDGRRSMAPCRATVRSASPAAAVSVPLRPPSLAGAPRPTPTAVVRAYTAPRSGSRAVVASRAGIARGTPDSDSDSRVGACSRTRDTTPAPPGCVATVARVRSLSPLLVTPPARLASRVTLRASIWLISIST